MRSHGFRKDHFVEKTSVSLLRRFGGTGSLRTGDLSQRAERVRPADHRPHRPYAELDAEDEWVQLVLAQLNGIKAALDMLVRFRRGGTATGARR
jgi:hypothetical protein